MDKCEYALANMFLTGLTAAVEYNNSTNKDEGIHKITKRIKKNKTAEATFDCLFDTNCNCK